MRNYKKLCVIMLRCIMASVGGHLRPDWPFVACWLYWDDTIIITYYTRIWKTRSCSVKFRSLLSFCQVYMLFSEAHMKIDKEPRNRKTQHMPWCHLLLEAVRWWEAEKLSLVMDIYIYILVWKLWSIERGGLWWCTHHYPYKQWWFSSRKPCVCRVTHIF